MTALDTFFSVAWLAFWVYWLVAATGAKRSRPGTSRCPCAGARVAVVIVVFTFIKAPLLRGHSLTVHNPLAEAVGTILFVLGLGLAIWARVHIGANWGVPMSRREEPELVTSGPYRFIRHPIYSGVLLALLGTGIAVTLYWFAAVVLIGCYFVYSATVEERGMAEQFPQEYAAYRSRTRMLIPFVL